MIERMEDRYLRDPYLDNIRVFALEISPLSDILCYPDIRLVCGPHVWNYVFN